MLTTRRFVQSVVASALDGPVQFPIQITIADPLP